jgi:hypothetical protein
MGCVQNIVNKRLIGLKAKAPADAEALFDLYIQYSGLRVTNVPNSISFGLRDLGGLGA